jgi:hypothetical protein
MSTTKPRVGGTSPWGKIQTTKDVGPDVVVVTTESHGGAWVAPQAEGTIPAHLRAYGLRWANGARGWYEEDVAIVAPMAYVPTVPAAERERARAALPVLEDFAARKTG